MTAIRKKAKSKKPARPKLASPSMRSTRQPLKISAGLPDGVDWIEWLTEHGLVQLPEPGGVFYVVTYDRDRDEDPEYAFETGSMFAELEDARVAAYESSRGNMPHVVVRCEIVGRSEAHEG